MTCIHTGCDVYFPEYGTRSHGDLHHVGSAFIFIGSRPQHCQPGSESDIDWQMWLSHDGLERIYATTYIVAVTSIEPVSTSAKKRANDH